MDQRGERMTDDMYVPFSSQTGQTVCGQRCPICNSAMTVYQSNNILCLVCGYDSGRYGWRKVV